MDLSWLSYVVILEFSLTVRPFACDCGPLPGLSQQKLTSPAGNGVDHLPVRFQSAKDSKRQIQVVASLGPASWSEDACDDLG